MSKLNSELLTPINLIAPIDPLLMVESDKVIIPKPELELYKVYNLTFNGKRYVSNSPPDNLPPKDYSLIITQYNKEKIITIKGIYITPSNQSIEVEFKNLDIRSVLNTNNTNNTNDNYLEIVNKYYDSLDLEGGLSILLSVNLLDEEDSDNNDKDNSNDNSDNDKLIKIFIVGLSSVLVYYSFMKLDNNNLEKPFYPFTIEMPLDIVDLTVLNNKLYQYINYIGKILVSLPTKKIGKYWIQQCTKFYDAFGSLLPKDYNLSEALWNKVIYLAISGYSQWLVDREFIMAQNFNNTVNEIIEEGCNDIQYKISQGILRIQENLDQYSSNNSNNSNNNTFNSEIERYKRYCKKCLKRCKEIEYKYHNLEKRLQALEKDDEYSKENKKSK